MKSGGTSWMSEKKRRLLPLSRKFSKALRARRRAVIQVYKELDAQPPNDGSVVGRGWQRKIQGDGKG